MPSAAEIEYRIIREESEAAIVRLYRDAGWWKEEDSPSFIPAMIAGSTVFVGAYDDGRLVGMGRAISDGVSDGCIQDVIVDRAYRRCGIGASIVRLVAAELRRRGVDWIQLIGVPGTREFYESLGFRVMENHLPMLLAVPSES